MEAPPAAFRSMPETYPTALLRLPAWARHVLAALACVATTLIANPLAFQVDSANIIMLFLLTVFLVALFLGRSPALLAAFLSVALFDFFYVPPHLTFAVEDVQYLITFLVMLAVAILTGQLVARLGQQAQEAMERETRTRALYEMARELAGALSVAQVGEITRRLLAKVPHVEAVLHLSGDDGVLRVLDGDQPGPASPALPCRAYERGEAVEQRGASGLGEVAMYLPMAAPMRVRGVLELRSDADTLGKEGALLDTVASLAALTLERLHYVAVAQATQVQMEAERLRTSVLSSLSHDLRTPLTVLVGLAETLALARETLPPAQGETLEALRQQALRLSGMVDNLLDLARLSAGRVSLRKEWQPLEEVVGAAIKLLGPALGGHAVRVDLAADLPLLEFDAVLLERVLCNLLDNAAKHAPPGSAITLSARTGDGQAEISVCDDGPGFPPGMDLVTCFPGGMPGAAASDAGLGLSICGTIIAAHGGALNLENPPGGGACARFTLPLGNPPVVEAEEVLEEKA